MKSEEYWQGLERISSFCSMATSGIIVVEVNSVVTKDEFLSDFRKIFNADVVSLNIISLGQEKYGDNPLCTHKNNPIIVDELISDDIQNTVINLNYNRDWFLGLQRNIIFLLSTETVTELIGYSSNFWSCVSIHEQISIRPNCIIKPYLFTDSIGEYNSRIEAERDMERRTQLNLKSTSDIIKFVLGEDSYFQRGTSSLIDLLRDKSDKVEGNEVEARILSEKIFELGKIFFDQSMYSKAEICFAFIIVRYSRVISLAQRYYITRLLAETFYLRGQYERAAKLYKEVIDISEPDQLDEELLASPESDPTVAWNNCGVTLYMIGSLDLALSCFHKAYYSGNFTEDNTKMIWVLFNLSLLSLRLNDYKNAQYYIQTALSSFPVLENRRLNIIKARCNVLYACILSSIGSIVRSRSIIDENLSLLREQLVENHAYIMEAHYVFALIHLQNDRLKQAEHCIERADEIASRVLVDKDLKAQIWALRGEIYFYLGKHRDAKKYLNMAIARGKHRDIFSKELYSWMQTTVESIMENQSSIPE